MARTKIKTENGWKYTDVIVSNNVVDTTQETIVGTYIYMDGDVKKSKPIYQKAIYYTSWNTGSNPHNIENIDTVIDVKGIAKSNRGLYYNSSVHIAENLQFITFVDISNIYLYAIKTDEPPHNFNTVMVTIQYTKTTDTPTIV